jgi:hypothetical protein
MAGVTSEFFRVSLVPHSLKSLTEFLLFNSY